MCRNNAMFNAIFNIIQPLVRLNKVKNEDFLYV